MRILLTGGAGFIGSHVAEQLIVHDHEVAVVDDLSTGKRENVPEGVRFYELDIRSERGLTEVFEEFQPELLSHQAAQMDVRRSVREPNFDAAVNVLGTINLLEHSVKHGVSKVVFASTGGAVYGEQSEFPAKEDHPQYPVSPYGVSKLAAERYLHFYNVQYGLPYAALRYSNVYGPRQDPHGEAGVVAIFCGNLALGQPSMIYGTGAQTRDYIYVEDVARANVLVLENELSSGAYNIGTGVEISVNRLYELLQTASGREDLLPEHRPAKPGEQSRSSVDPAKIVKAVEWKPRIGLKVGLMKTLHSFGAV